MVAPAFHLSWYNPVDVCLTDGLLTGLVPSAPFIMLADPAAIDADTAGRLRAQWGSACLQWVWQGSLVSSLDAAIVLGETVWHTLDTQPQVALWAVGGGTTMDLAKLVRWRFADANQALYHWRANTQDPPAVRHELWCTPTTAGTGSEVTPWATVWDLHANPACKRSWHPAHGFAERAWIDPLLTHSCPPGVTRDSGLDAMSHALESLWNRHADRLSRSLAIEAARMVWEALPAVMNQPQSWHARTRMAQASLMAGLAMSQTQTALAHALSYDLTLREQLPHGQACAVWLPMTMEIAAARSSQVRQDLEAVFGLPVARCVAEMHAWLGALDVSARDLRESPDGLGALNAALTSARGRNFIEEEKA